MKLKKLIEIFKIPKEMIMRKLENFEEELLIEEVFTLSKMDRRKIDELVENLIESTIVSSRVQALQLLIKNARELYIYEIN